MPADDPPENFPAFRPLERQWSYDQGRQTTHLMGGKLAEKLILRGKNQQPFVVSASPPASLCGQPVAGADIGEGLREAITVLWQHAFK